MPLSRRHLLVSVLAAGGLSAGFAPAARGAGAWPEPAAWKELEAEVGGRLIAVTSPLAACEAEPAGPACTRMLQAMQNPFFVQDQPGGFQTNGWLDAWQAEISPFAVAAESASDIAAAVAFARRHGVRLVVKGAAHDYLGRNSAADSLLVWTHRMRDVAFDPDFRIAGAAAGTPGVPALTLGAGTRWIEAYRAASAQGRYVQGGGCTSVGVAGGFIQGGGFGSFSKRFGSGAGSVLQYEVVTADGQIRVANALENSDLFWALRGGGGGTFGIVSEVTLLTHPQPRSLGLLRGSVQAADAEGFRALLARLVAWYPAALNNPDWGEQIALRPDNRLEVFLVFLDQSREEALAVWEPLRRALAEAGMDLNLQAEVTPFSRHWDAGYWQETRPSFVQLDARAGAEPGHFWWSPNQGEVGQFIDSYCSRWIPLSLFREEAAPRLVEALFAASRHARVSLHINKGLAGASERVLAREEATSMNPLAREAAALAIVASTQQARYPGLAGHEPDRAAGARRAEAVNAAIRVLRDATPGGGAYLNEADYFEPGWQESFYGRHYERLLAVKRRYDPDNLFHVHHGVGSED